MRNGSTECCLEPWLRTWGLASNLGSAAACLTLSKCLIVEPELPWQQSALGGHEGDGGYVSASHSAWFTVGAHGCARGHGQQQQQDLKETETPGKETAGTQVEGLLQGFLTFFPFPGQRSCHIFIILMSIILGRTRVCVSHWTRRSGHPTSVH